MLKPIKIDFFDIPQMKTRYLEIHDDHWPFMKKVIENGLVQENRYPEFQEISPYRGVESKTTTKGDQ